MTDEIAKSMGFNDAAELHKLVALVDLTSMEQARAFREWKNNDGTKVGLMRLQRLPVSVAAGAPVMESLMPGDRVTCLRLPGSRGTFRGYLPNLVNRNSPAAAVIWDAEWKSEVSPLGAAKDLSRVVE